MFAAGLSHLAQVQVYPTIAIDTTTNRVRGADQYQQSLILDGAIGQRSFDPFVEAAVCDWKQTAHQLHGMLASMFVDELVIHSGF